MKRTNIFLTDDQLKKLKAESRKTGLSMADRIRRLIDAHFDKPKSKSK